MIVSSTRTGRGCPPPWPPARWRPTHAACSADASLAPAIRSAASVTLAGTAGTLAALAIAPTYQARLDLRVALALGAAALAYLTVTVGLASVTTAARRRGRFAPIFPRQLRAKLVMRSATSAGLTVALRADWRFILLLTPGSGCPAFTRTGCGPTRSAVWHAFAERPGTEPVEERRSRSPRRGRASFPARRTEVVAWPDGWQRRYAGARDGPSSSASPAPQPTTADDRQRGGVQRRWCGAGQVPRRSVSCPDLRRLTGLT
jgi:hypothetical protein